jgi:AcrR family transcriptional regulator
MAIQARAFFRTPDDLRVHRQQLYRRAAPVFRRHGYRQATLKQLAAACGLSIPALYRYFPSKRDFALYPLSAANRPDGECFGRASSDPLIHLRIWLDHAAWERQDFLLAVRLGLEMGEQAGLSEEHRQTFGFHIGLVSGWLPAAAPGLTERRARELTESLLAISFGAEAIGNDWAPVTARTRFIGLLVPDLVRAGAEPDRIREAMSTEHLHPPHGPCSIELASNAVFFAMSRIHLTETPAKA